MNNKKIEIKKKRLAEGGWEVFLLWCLFALGPF
jgi:hypothetical protein